MKNIHSIALLLGLVLFTASCATIERAGIVHENPSQIEVPAWEGKFLETEFYIDENVSEFELMLEEIRPGLQLTMVDFLGLDSTQLDADTLPPGIRVKPAKNSIYQHLRSLQRVLEIDSGDAIPGHSGPGILYNDRRERGVDYPAPGLGQVYRPCETASTPSFDSLDFQEDFFPINLRGVYGSYGNLRIVDIRHYPQSRTFPIKQVFVDSLSQDFAFAIRGVSKKKRISTKDWEDLRLLYNNLRAIARHCPGLRESAGYQYSLQGYWILDYSKEVYKEGVYRISRDREGWLRQAIYFMESQEDSSSYEHLSICMILEDAGFTFFHEKYLGNRDIHFPGKRSFHVSKEKVVLPERPKNLSKTFLRLEEAFKKLE